jgi:hypothetical protein
MNTCDESPFQQISAYTLTIEPYLNTFSKQYENIIVIDKMPLGPLGQLVSRFRAPRLSPFDYNNDSFNKNDCCKFAIRRHFRRDNEFLTADDVPSLLAYLSTNGYSINSEITKIVQKTKYNQRKSFVCVFYYTVV